MGDRTNDALDFLETYTGTFPFLVSIKERVDAGRLLSPKQVAAVLKCMAVENKRAEQKEDGPAPPDVVEAGMYRVNDTIYKVQKAVHGSGRLYAKRLVPPDEFGGKAEFVYEPGTIKMLVPADKMTLDEARAFGALYGTCCVCGRTLTDEKSIERGIGPVCEGRV